MENNQKATYEAVYAHFFYYKATIGCPGFYWRRWVLVGGGKNLKPTNSRTM